MEELGKILEKYKNAKINEENCLNFYTEIYNLYKKIKENNENEKD